MTLKHPKTISIIIITIISIIINMGFHLVLSVKLLYLQTQEPTGQRATLTSANLRWVSLRSLENAR